MTDTGLPEASHGDPLAESGPLLSRVEVAQELGVSPVTVDRLLATGALPSRPDPRGGPAVLADDVEAYRVARFARSRA